MSRMSYIPECVSSKKHNALYCHAVCETTAAGILQVFEEKAKMNVADLSTQVWIFPNSLNYWEAFCTTNITAFRISSIDLQLVQVLTSICSG